MPGIYGTPSPFTLSLISDNVEQAVSGLNKRNIIINVFFIIVELYLLNFCSTIFKFRYFSIRI